MANTSYSFSRKVSVVSLGAVISFCALGGYAAGAGKPTITAVAPSSGKTGTWVKITGSDLLPGGTTDIVEFGGVVASKSGRLSSTSLWAVVPTGAKSGKVSVHVETPAATILKGHRGLNEQALSPEAFTVR
jgi:hypothetical protein